MGPCSSTFETRTCSVIWHISARLLRAVLQQSELRPKDTSVENSVFGSLGRGNWTSTLEGIVEGLAWAPNRGRCAPPEYTRDHGKSRITLDDPIHPGADIRCRSSTDLSCFPDASFDLVITDPPFGDNIYYSDLANFFYAWLRLPLRSKYPDLFDRKLADNSGVENASKTPSTQEAVKPRWLPEEEGNERYRSLLTACWIEAHRVLKDGGLLAFTFHHSEDAQWAIVL